MFRHVVLFRWTEATTPDAIAAASAALAALPGQIPELRSYRFGPDAAMNDGNYDFAVVADFDDADGYLAYRDHPSHQAVIADHLRVMIAERAAAQYAT